CSSDVCSSDLGDGAARQRVLHHAQVHAGFPCRPAQVRHLRHREATVLRGHGGEGRAGHARDLLDERLLFFESQCHRLLLAVTWDPCRHEPHGSSRERASCLPAGIRRRALTPLPLDGDCARKAPTQVTPSAQAACAIKTRTRVACGLRRRQPAGRAGCRSEAPRGVPWRPGASSTRSPVPFPDQASSDAWSTVMPGPMVEDTVTFFTYVPLEAEGFAF